MGFRGRGKMLVGAFGGLEAWFRPKVVRLEYLLDAEDEKVVRRLRTKGHELHWAFETRLRQLQRDGWKPLPNGTRQDGGQFLWIIAKRLFCCTGLQATQRIRHERINQTLLRSC
jgi:hypothetical protein